MRDEDFPPLDLSMKDLPGPLTPDAYAAKGGHACPACGGRDLASGRIDIPGGVQYLTRLAECENCGATWTAVYELTGYEGLSVPTERPGRDAEDATGDPLLAHWGEPHVTDDTACFCGPRAFEGLVVHRRMPWEQPGQREGEA
jgi:hypothetical protein